jgi:plastocyanin
VLAALPAALLLAGCGSSSKSSGPTAASTTPAAPAESATTAPSSAGGHPLALAANPQGQFKYMPSTLSAPAGTVAISFTNVSPVEHNLTVASASGQVLGATPTIKGTTKTLTLSLKPGVYKFYCTVPGHRAAGMEGTLTVR